MGTMLGIAASGIPLERPFVAGYRMFQAWKAARYVKQNVGPAYNVALGSKLADSLAEAQRLSSPYNAEGKLTEEATSLSREIIPAYRFANDSRIPSGMAKYSTRSYESAYGNYSAHFYMNPKTNEVFYGIDYKSVFDKMSGVPK